MLIDRRDFLKASAAAPLAQVATTGRQNKHRAGLTCRSGFPIDCRRWTGARRAESHSTALIRPRLFAYRRVSAS